MAVLNNGLQLLGVGADLTQIIKGLVLLIAVAFDVYNKTAGQEVDHRHDDEELRPRQREPGPTRPPPPKRSSHGKPDRLSPLGFSAHHLKKVNQAMQMFGKAGKAAAIAAIAALALTALRPFRHDRPAAQLGRRGVPEGLRDRRRAPPEDQ